jgi:tetratricopeptide (TPR) repeat protein
VLAGSPAYGDFHKSLERKKDSSPVAAWVYALSSIRKGDNAAAQAVLEKQTDAPVSPREKLVCLEELAGLQSDNPDRALSLHRQALALAPDSDHLHLLVAQLLYRKHAYDEATSILLTARPDRLEEGERGVFTNTLLSSIAATQQLPDLIRAFEKHTAGLTYERLRQVAEAPFVTLQGSKYEDLRALLAARTAEADAPPELHVLRMSLENRLSNPDGIAEALRAYTNARPNMADAVEEYADVMSQKAYRVATADPSSSPSAERQKEVADAAARALWSAVRLRPYTPEPYSKLMELYRLFGDDAKARQVPLVLSDPTTATAENVHLAAYIYATNGYPAESLPIYERALKLAPEKTRYRLNYAGALSRAGRPKDAMAIYQDLVQHGVNGRQFHPHDVLVNSIQLANERGEAASYEAFLKNLIADKYVPQHDLFLVETARAFLATGHPEEAVPFLEALRQQYPQHAETAADLLVQTRVARKDFAAAEALLAQEEKETTDTAGRVLVRSNLAEVKRQQGKVDEAVRIWSEIGRQYPQDRQAARKLITAAQVLVETSKLQQAQQLLQEYLGRDLGDPDGEQLAREVLSKIKRLDVPSASIVQSAMQETTGTF